MQAITITTTDGPRTVNARIDGPFALHQDDNGTWAVTHIFTGMSVISGICEYDAERTISTLTNLDDWYFGWLDMGEYNAQTGSASRNEALKASRAFLRKLLKEYAN